MQGCAIYICGAVFIPFSYVGLIYALDDRTESRDYFPNVRRRFVAAILTNAIGVSSTLYLLRWHYSDPFSQMGFRPMVHFRAVIYPTILTLIFYSGTLLVLLLDGSLRKLFDLNVWRNAFKDLLWVRHVIVAPTTEEIAFRACSAPLLKHCFGTQLATFITPITFSFSHIHHIFEDQKQGLTLKEALWRRGFQMVYTYLFGLYATHIFFRTGHILAPILSHSICNLLGIPALDEVSHFGSRWTRSLLYVCHVSGFVGWYIAMPFLLGADFYQNCR